VLILTRGLGVNPRVGAITRCGEAGTTTRYGSGHQTVESRIRPKGGFGVTAGKLLTLSKSKLFLKYVLTPAQKLRNISNL